jgi:hypothetical protein
MIWYKVKSVLTGPLYRSDLISTDLTILPKVKPKNLSKLSKATNKIIFSQFNVNQQYTIINILVSLDTVFKESFFFSERNVDTRTWGEIARIMITLLYHSLQMMRTFAVHVLTKQLVKVEPISMMKRINTLTTIICKHVLTMSNKKRNRKYN